MAIRKETKKAKSDAAEAKAPATTTSNIVVNDVLVRPLLSEKTTRLEGIRQYSFEIMPKATKVQVKQAVKAAYGVEPTKVNIVNTDGKVKRFGLRLGRRNAVKKAIVTLPKGKNIDIHAGV